MILIYSNKEAVTLAKFNGVQEFLKETMIEGQYDDLRNATDVLCMTKDISFNEPMNFTEVYTILQNYSLGATQWTDVYSDNFRGLDWYKNAITSCLHQKGFDQILPENMAYVLDQIMLSMDLGIILNDSADIVTLNQAIFDAIDEVFE